MTESIADIVLRLAHQQLAAEPNAKLDWIAPDSSSFPNVHLADRALSAAPVNSAGAESLAQETADRESLPSSVSPSPDLPSAQPRNREEVSFAEGDAPSSEHPPSNEFPHAIDAHSAPPLVPDLPPNRFDLSWHTEPETVFPAAPMIDSEVATPPARRSGRDDGNRQVEHVIETVGEHTQRLEEVLNELEQSMTSLLTTQLNSFHRLRDQAQEQERRWLEQTADRRASYSQP